MNLWLKTASSGGVIWASDSRSKNTIRERRYCRWFSHSIKNVIIKCVYIYSEEFSLTCSREKGQEKYPVDIQLAHPYSNQRLSRIIKIDRVTCVTTFTREFALIARISLDFSLKLMQSL